MGHSATDTIDSLQREAYNVLTTTLAQSQSNSHKMAPLYRINWEKTPTVDEVLSLSEDEYIVDHENHLYVKGTVCNNRISLHFTCPFCVSSYKKDGSPTQRSKNVKHFHGTGRSLEKQITHRIRHCGNHGRDLYAKSGLIGMFIAYDPNVLCFCKQCKKENRMYISELNN